MTGSIKQRSRGSYQVAIYLGFDANGRQQYHRETVRGTKKDAQVRLAELLNRLHRGEAVKASKTTLGGYLDEWLESYAKANVSPKTYERYEELVRLTIKPHAGNIVLDHLQPIQLQRLYSTLLQSGRKKKAKSGKTGLSARTVLHVHRLLHQALKRAVKWQLLFRNPCDAVEPPRPESHEMRTLNAAESAWLLEAVLQTRLYPGILLGISTGLRRGEVLGMRWSDIDFISKKLIVNQAIEKTNAGIRFKQPKTKRSRRQVALPEFAVSALREFRARQDEERKLYGTDYADHNLVCARPDGSPMDPDVYSSDVIDFMKKIGLAGVSFHKLRHGYATHLLAQNVHPKVVQELLGHSSIAITMDLYSHIIPGMQEEAVAKLDSMMSGAIAKQKQQPRN
jgi:integrase